MWKLFFTNLVSVIRRSMTSVQNCLKERGDLVNCSLVEYNRKMKLSITACVGRHIWEGNQFFSAEIALRQDGVVSTQPENDQGNKSCNSLMENQSIACPLARKTWQKPCTVSSAVLRMSLSGQLPLRQRHRTDSIYYITERTGKRTEHSQLHRLCMRQ